MYGSSKCLEFVNGCEVLNFTSLYERIPRLNLLPPREFGRNFDYDFDIVYAQWIFANDYVFFDFMRIIYSIYQGKDVFILIDDVFDQLNESLIKLIQQRYGYEAYKVESLEDYMYADNSNFSEIGLLNLDIDKDRLSYMLEAERIRQGGQVDEWYSV